MIEIIDETWMKWFLHLIGQYMPLCFYRHLKNLGGLNWIRTNDLCDAGAAVPTVLWSGTHLNAAGYIF